MHDIDAPAADQGVRKRTGRRAFVFSLLALGVAGLVVATFVVTGGFSFQPQTLRESLGSIGDVTTVEENTSTLCVELNCIEAWRTGVGVFLRFPTEGTAEYSQYVIGGDSIRNGTVVLDMNGFDLTAQQRGIAVDLLFPGRDW